MDSLCTYITKIRSRTTKPALFETLQKRMESQLEKQLKLASTMFQLVLFDTVNNQFTLTRSLCSLLIYNPPILEFYAKVLIEAQIDENKKALQKLFEDLVAVVRKGGRVTGVVRDKFQRIVISLRVQVGNLSIIPVY